MDGGSMQSGGQNEPLPSMEFQVKWDSIDDGPPRLWLAFLAMLAIGVGTLAVIVFTVLPRRHASARFTPPSAVQVAALQHDIAALTAQRTALEDERRRLDDAIRAAAAAQEQPAGGGGAATRRDGTDIAAYPPAVSAR
jgi:hypothetical protein